MKPGYDISNPTMKDWFRIERDYERTFKKFNESGISRPNLAIGIVNDMYTNQYEKELNKSFAKGKNDISPIAEWRFDVLRKITEIKIYEAVMKLNNPDDCLTFSFLNGKPDEQTSEFLNLSDNSGRPINIARTGSLEYPKGFTSFDDEAARVDLKVFKDGEILAVQNKQGEEIYNFNSLPMNFQEQ